MTHPRFNRRLAFIALALSPVLIAPLWVDSPFPAQKPQAPAAPNAAALMLPRKEGSVRFAVMGDTGRGTREQNEVGQQMAAFHKAFPFDFVIMLGDNIYGADTPADMVNKFTTPYKALLDAGVTFHAALGNHDNPNQRFDKPFNMGGERFYTFRVAGSGPFEPTGGGVRFFALDTDYLDKPQLLWLEKELSSSNTDWKISFFHHPLYSSGGTHGSALETRAILEPLFVKYGVSAVFSGHDHFYERIKPQKGGIGYWVSGAGGSLRKGDIRRTDLTAKGFDTDYHFMIVEIAGDDLYFQTISRTGATVDSGVFHRPGAAPIDPAAAVTPGAASVPVDAPVVGKTGRSTPEGQAALPQVSPTTPTPTPVPAPTPKN
jgi:predicted MPP superfamily phosphohydrolase